MSEGDNFWEGPYGVRVPNDIPSIWSADGVNYLTKRGFMSLVLGMNPPPTRDEYLEKYATLDADGHYYYKREHALYYK